MLMLENIGQLFVAKIIPYLKLIFFCINLLLMGLSLLFHYIFYGLINCILFGLLQIILFHTAQLAKSKSDNFSFLFPAGTNEKLMMNIQFNYWYFLLPSHFAPALMNLVQLLQQRKLRLPEPLFFVRAKMKLPEKPFDLKYCTIILALNLLRIRK